MKNVWLDRKKERENAEKFVGISVADWIGPPSEITVTVTCIGPDGMENTWAYTAPWNCESYNWEIQTCSGILGDGLQVNAPCPTWEIQTCSGILGDGLQVNAPCQIWDFQSAIGNNHEPLYVKLISVDSVEPTSGTYIEESK